MSALNSVTGWQPGPGGVRALKMLGACICPGDSHVATGSPTIIHCAIAATRTSRRYRSRNAILGGGDEESDWTTGFQDGRRSERCPVERPWRTLKFEHRRRPLGIGDARGADAYFTALVEGPSQNQSRTPPDESGGGLSQSLGWASSDPDRA